MLVSPGVDVALFGVLGLLVGSFLNVVIHRLPKMMELEWAANCAELAGKDVPAVEPFNLSRPRSRCPSCQHQIRWYENIPVLSFAVLRGRCAKCKTSISVRYPVIEIVTAVFFVAMARMYGPTAAGLVWAALACLLIAQFCIDLDTQLLPDDLNYIILWLGLIASAMGLTTVALSSSVWGAVFGYLSLWSVYQVHHRLTGKQGMGHGDFKLLAGLGAWFGAEYLVALILLSSVVGSILGGGLLLVGKLANRDIPIPFGPFLAGAGMVAMLAGPGRLESTVAEFFTQHRAVVIDADAISRATTASGGLAIAPIAAAFGADFITADGALDRARMRQASFSDPAARATLESIVHPLVAQESALREQNALDAGAPCIVFDVPLLVAASVGPSGPSRAAPRARFWAR